MRLYRERERGGGVKDRRHYNFKDFSMGTKIIGGGTVFHQDSSPLLLNFQVLPAAQIGRSETADAGASGRLESGAANQALFGALQEVGGH